MDEHGSVILSRLIHMGKSERERLIETARQVSRVTRISVDKALTILMDERDWHPVR